MKTQIPVLIVGAGPTGLLAACELSRHGIPVRIIDKKPEASQTSNALGIQPRTLELFDLIGIVDRFLKAGHPAAGVRIYRDGKVMVRMELNGIDSPYPFIFLLPQNVTEKILAERLQEFTVSIERSRELVSVTKNTDYLLAKIKHANGEIEEIHCHWIIGCDGLHSAVRENTSIIFEGEDIPQPFLLADASLETKLPKNILAAFFSKKNIMAIFPIEGDRYRLMGSLNESTDTNSIDDALIREVVKKRSYGIFSLKSINWSSHFWIHSKAVNAMREGRIFIAGDAAHVHSPVGGQGMNTGLQDVHNLAWKLALVIKGSAKDTLLESYNAERLPVVKGIVAVTDRLSRMMLSKNPLLKGVRFLAMKTIPRIAFLRKKLSQRLTQIATRYHKSPAIDTHHVMSAHAPKPGERAPDVLLSPQHRLYDSLRNTQHNVLLFIGENFPAHLLPNLIENIKNLNRIFPELLNIHIVSTTPINEVNNLILDSNKTAHARYGVKYPGLYLIRPDNIVAYCSNRLDFKSLQEFLSSYLKNSLAFL